MYCGGRGMHQTAFALSGFSNLTNCVEMEGEEGGVAPTGLFAGYVGLFAVERSRCLMSRNTCMP